jgi:hypothetical protein
MPLFSQNKIYLGYKMELSRISIGPAVLFSFFLLSSLLIPLVFCSSENWIEVARFTETGQGSTKTETFECSHVDWRIRWSFLSSINEPPLIFAMTVYNSSGKIVDFFITTVQGSGTLDYNRTGSFYLNIRVNYVQNYQVIVEQNIDSIPEFPSWTILPFFLIATVCAIIVKKRLFSQTS